MCSVALLNKLLNLNGWLMYVLKIRPALKNLSVEKYNY